MGIVVLDEGTPYVLAIKGRLDTFSAPQLAAKAEALYHRGVNDIVLDMSGCDFVSSAGLRVLVIMQKHAAVDGSLLLRNVHPDVTNIFEITEFDKILEVEEP